MIDELQKRNYNNTMWVNVNNATALYQNNLRYEGSIFAYVISFMWMIFSINEALV